MKQTAAALIVVLVAGCGAVARSTGAMQLGPDTFRVATRAPMGNVGESQKMALAEAQAHCKLTNKELMVISTRQLQDVGVGPFEATFRCLAMGDPDLKRPTLQQAPSTIIQMQ